MKVVLDEIYTFGMKVVLDELVFYHIKEYFEALWWLPMRTCVEVPLPSQDKSWILNSQWYETPCHHF